MTASLRRRAIDDHQKGTCVTSTLRLLNLSAKSKPGNDRRIRDVIENGNEKLFAFARWRGDEQLIIVSNFDHLESSHETKTRDSGQPGFRNGNSLTAATCLMSNCTARTRRACRRDWSSMAVLLTCYWSSIHLSRSSSRLALQIFSDTPILPRNLLGRVISTCGYQKTTRTPTRLSSAVLSRRAEPVQS